MCLRHRNIWSDTYPLQILFGDRVDRASNRDECFEVRVYPERNARMGPSVGLITDYDGALAGLQDRCKFLAACEGNLAG